MKKISLFVFIILICHNAYDQGNYTIKPTSSWRIDKLINVISKKDKRSKGDETYKVFISGDTLINTLSYFKLYKSGLLYLDSIIKKTDIYIGAVRNSGHQVYFIDKSKSAEELLYDFNMITGDTIKGLVGNGKIVTDVDTLKDGRKLFHISKSMLHAMDAYIVEGIGSSGGLLNEPPVGHYMFDDSYLICYSENDSLVYYGTDPLENGCNLSFSRFQINPSSIWKIVNLNYYLDTQNFKINDKYTYFIENDTLINYYRYYKLYKTGVAY
jgi:hypothetical protein